MNLPEVHIWRNRHGLVERVEFHDGPQCEGRGFDPRRPLPVDVVVASEARVSYGERETSMPSPDARPPDPPPNAYWQGVAREMERAGLEELRLREIAYLRTRMLVAVSFLVRNEDLYDKFVEHTAWLDARYRSGS